VNDDLKTISTASENLRFAAAVAEFGMLLRGSEFKSSASYADVITLASAAKGKDEQGYRAEFVRLVENAQFLAKAKPESKKEETTKIH
jgi:Ca-activated chloride channel family protein